MYNLAKSEASVRGTRRIYLDYAASTPISPAARKAMRLAARFSGNPSSLHEEGRRAREVYEDARSRVARIVGAQPQEIIFTGSGSEADALAVIGVARAHRRIGTHLIVSSIEHKAILKSAEALAGEGFSISYLPVSREGLASPEDLAKLLREDTILVSVMYANNEIGTVESIQKLAEVVQAHRSGTAAPFFHTDACQAPGQLPISVADLGVDLMSINSSKVYGPKGIGALYIRQGIPLVPLIGGEQERSLRGGTESAELAAGFAAALEEADGRREEETLRLRGLRDLFFSEIERSIPDAVINGHRTQRLPNNIHVSLPGIEGESILLLLDAAGIACATGSACNSFDLAPSHVLLALGNDAPLAHGSIRFSLGRETTEEDVRQVVYELSRIVERLRGISALTTHLAV